MAPSLLRPRRIHFKCHYRDGFVMCIACCDFVPCVAVGGHCQNRSKTPPVWSSQSLRRMSHWTAAGVDQWLQVPHPQELHPCLHSFQFYFLINVPRRLALPTIICENVVQGGVWERTINFFILPFPDSLQVEAGSVDNAWNTGKSLVSWEEMPPSPSLNSGLQPMTPTAWAFLSTVRGPNTLTQKVSEKPSQVDTVIHLSSRLELVLRIL